MSTYNPPPQADAVRKPAQPVARQGFHGVLDANSAQATAYGSTHIARDTHSGSLVCVAGEPAISAPGIPEIRGAGKSAQWLLDALLAQSLDMHRLEFRGAFTLAVVDVSGGRVWLVTDRMTTFPLYYFLRDGQIGFGTTPPGHQETASADGAGASAGLTPQAVLMYLYFHMIPGPGTAFEGVHKLRTACIASLSLEGDCRVSKHWQANFAPVARRESKTLQQELRSTLSTAVRDATVDKAKTGCFLSGGLDSSTVSGLFAEAYPQKPTAFAIGFDAEGYDEMPYARISAEHFGLHLVELYVSPDDVVDALPRLAASFPEPFGNSSALPAFFCAQQARRTGVTHLLAGDGGDELFAGNARYAEQLIYERFTALPRGIRTLVAALTRVLPADKTLLSKGRRFVDNASLGTAVRLQRYNFLHGTDLRGIFAEEVLRDLDGAAPLAQWTADYARLEQAHANPVDRMLALDWQYTLAENDLRKVTHACSLADVTVSYPMLDDRVIDLALRVPAREKLRATNLRIFFKKAFDDFLPEATIRKKKHGFGLPFGVWMRDHAPLQELARDALASLSRRTIFRQDFLDRAIQNHRDGHAAYFGELVWILVVLELWLQHNAPDWQAGSRPVSII